MKDNSAVINMFLNCYIATTKALSVSLDMRSTCLKISLHVAILCDKFFIHAEFLIL